MEISGELESVQVFKKKENTQYRGFKKYKPLMSSVDWKKVTKWAKNKF